MNACRVSYCFYGTPSISFVILHEDTAEGRQRQGQRRPPLQASRWNHLHSYWKPAFCSFIEKKSMTAKSLEIIQKSLSRLQLRQINVSIRNSSGKLKICRSQSDRPDRGSLYQCGKAHRFPGFSSTMLVTALHRCYTTEHEALSFQEKNT